MLVHFLFDVYAFTNADVVNDSGVMAAAATTRDVVITVVLFVIQIGIAAYLLRKSVRGEILEVWEKKWNRNIDDQKA